MRASLLALSKRHRVKPRTQTPGADTTVAARGGQTPIVTPSAAAAAAASASASTDPIPTPAAAAPSPVADVAPPIPAAEAVPATSIKVGRDGVRRLQLFHSNRQLQARLLPAAGFVQAVLSGIHVASTREIKNQMVLEDRMLQARDGFTEITSRPWYEFMFWSDYLLTGVVVLSPVVLFIATRYSTQRWIHELSLLPGNMAEVVTYNWIGSLTSRRLPVTSIVRRKGSLKTVFIEGKTYQLPQTGKFDDVAAYTRVIKEKQ